MKIVRKLNFTRDNSHFFHADCRGKGGMTIELCNAYLITGKIIATSHLELENTGYPESQILYRPYDEDRSFDPDVTPPEANFRIYREEKKDLKLGIFPSEVSAELYTPFDIPPKTKSISVLIVPGDSVMICGKMTESYAIIDDNGNEIPLDSLIGNSSCNKSETSCEGVHQS